MSDASKSVFISYRRSVSKYLARLIFDRLRAVDCDVFLDVNTIDNGQFDVTILHQIAARPHFVLLLSPGALERCVNEGDWLAREIEEAMRLKRNIVPVIEEGFDFAKETDYLPPHLRDEFRRYNSIPLVHFYFDAVMDTLINRFLKQSVQGMSIATLPASEQSQAQAYITQAANSPLPTDDQLTAGRLFNEGYSKQEAEQWDDAIKAYTEALRLDPGYVEVLFLRGRVWVKKGEFDKAIADFDEALRLHPDHAYAFFYRGETHLLKEEYESAVDDYNQAESLDFKKVILYQERGTAYYHLGQWVNALDDDHLVVRARPNAASSYINRGEVYFVLKDYKNALSDFKKAANIEPDSPHALGGLAITHHALGNHKETARLWGKLLAIDSRYRNSKWTGSKLSWAPSLIEEARKVIAAL